MPDSQLPIVSDAIIGDILDPESRAQRIREIFARSEDHAKRIIMEADAANTRRTYASHVRQFWRWATAYKGEEVIPQYPVPPDAAKLFLTDYLGAMPDEIIDALDLRVTVDGKKTIRWPRGATVLAWIAALSRAHRERQMPSPFDTPALQEVLPLWELNTPQLARDMLGAGLRAHLTCIDPRCLDRAFAGRAYDATLLSDLPDGVDPCGENGEFHTFCHAGPMFDQPIAVRTGVVVERDGFVFADLLPAGLRNS